MQIGFSLKNPYLIARHTTQSSIWITLIALLVGTFLAILVSKTLAPRKELLETQAELIQAAKLATVGQLASGVAHEINNPLQAISGNLETAELILKEGKGIKEELPEVIQEMKVATRRSQEIVQGLLKFARRSTSLKEEVHVEEAIQEALQLTHNQLDKEHIHVEKILPSKIPTVIGNTRELMQVFVNFITNAVRAMSESERKNLRISAKVENGKILVSFQDTGCGISKETLPRIFEPFFTTSYKEAEGKMKGTGLGLSINQRIIKEHLGRIEVQSEPQKGSTFTVILPAQG